MSTQTPIASITLNAATSSVTFANIPQTYTDLVLVVNAKGTGFTGSGTYPYVRYNSDSNTNYSRTWLAGNGSTASSSRGSSENLQYLVGGTYIDGTFSYNSITQFMNYSNTTTYKTMLSRANNAGVQVDALAGLWRSTSAITSIVIYSSNGNFDTGSTFNLYGISTANINTGKAIGGDNVYSDGSYWYHVFNTSGTFTPTAALTADYLVVAGGGGGYVQGGGAGGLRSTVTATGGGGSLESALSLTAQAYTVTVGAGGIQGNSGTPGNGSNSSISGTGITAITSTGGGGTSSGGSNGNNGGSGGGAFNSGTAGTGTANQGFAGGAAPTSSAGGGGGGAGAVGSAGSGSTGGNGGNGVSTSISGSSIAYAGGGAGYGTGSSGTAGTGGGGTAGAASPTSDGATNRGGGGGGNNAGNGGKGGSGIVIIRYAV